jgi:hypothetical protein
VAGALARRRAAEEPRLQDRGGGDRVRCKPTQRDASDSIHTRASHRQDLGLLETCADYYRPLAEFLIGTGTRISEAITIRETGENLGPRLIEAIQKLGYDPERSLGLWPDFQQRKLSYAWAKA